MARTPGTFLFSANLERRVKGNIDATKFTPSYADLLTFTADNYMYNGCTVEVWDVDPQLRGIYQLIDETDLANPDSWERIGALPTPPGVIVGTQEHIERNVVNPAVAPITLQADVSTIYLYANNVDGVRNITLISTKELHRIYIKHFTPGDVTFLFYDEEGNSLYLSGTGYDENRYKFLDTLIVEYNANTEALEQPWSLLGKMNVNPATAAEVVAETARATAAEGALQDQINSYSVSVDQLNNMVNVPFIDYYVQVYSITGITGVSTVDNIRLITADGETACANVAALNTALSALTEDQAGEGYTISFVLTLVAGAEFATAIIKVIPEPIV